MNIQINLEDGSPYHVQFTRTYGLSCYTSIELNPGTGSGAVRELTQEELVILVGGWEELENSSKYDFNFINGPNGQPSGRVSGGTDLKDGMEFTTSKRAVMLL